MFGEIGVIEQCYVVKTFSVSTKKIHLPPTESEDMLSTSRPGKWEGKGG